MKRNLFIASMIGTIAAGCAFGQTEINDTNFPSSVSHNMTDGSYTIFDDLTLTTGNTYILDNFTFVEDGVTLTIQPGVIVRGQPAELNMSGDVITNPGSLIVSRGAQICADGTANDPIIFTTAADTNRERWSTGDSFLDANPATSPLPVYSGSPAEDNANLWGAVTLLGYAPINTGKVDTGVGGEAYIEGFGPDFFDERATYGGRNPSDSSGVLRYVSIRHTGQTYVTDEEQQGLTLGGVGSGTVLQYLDIYCTSDDGIEIFGGTADLDHVMISYADDDGLDIDQGYTGTMQFVFVLGSDLAASGNATGLSSDNLGEWDGDDDISDDDFNVSATGAPFTHPALYNMTFMGPRGTGTLTNMVRCRQGFGGDVRNSIFINAPSAQTSFRIDNTGTDHTNRAAPFDWGYPSVICRDQAEAGTLTFAGSMWYNVANNTVAGIGADNWAEDVLNNGSGALVEGSYLNQVGNNPFLGGVAQTGANALDPQPALLSTVDDVAYDACGVPCNIEPVDYIGAFEPGAPNWTADWTAMSLRGILAD